MKAFAIGAAGFLASIYGTLAVGYFTDWQTWSVPFGFIVLGGGLVGTGCLVMREWDL